MAIKEGNSRLTISMSDDIVCKLLYACDIEKRNKSQEVEYVLQYYFENINSDIFKTNEFSYYKNQVFNKEPKQKD